MNQTADKTDEFVGGLSDTTGKIDQLLDNLNNQLARKEFRSLPETINQTLLEIRKLAKSVGEAADAADTETTVEDLKTTLAENPSIGPNLDRTG